ncbi:uncharacterized protein [Palaemon carinicauda]|uniref:uncharacterized protein n=1 Tax=Palaemon carinicauda TaxID=392227 RepID=UPI0035B5D83D
MLKWKRRNSRRLKSECAYIPGGERYKDPQGIPTVLCVRCTESNTYLWDLYFFQFHQNRYSRERQLDKPNFPLCCPNTAVASPVNSWNSRFQTGIDLLPCEFYVNTLTQYSPEGYRYTRRLISQGKILARISNTVDPAKPIISVISAKLCQEIFFTAIKICLIEGCSQRWVQAEEKNLEREERLRRYDAERGKALAELEERERERRHALEERERERRHELEIKKLELEAARHHVEAPTVINNHSPKAKIPNLPEFVDGKDELDSYLLRFERYANTHKWDRSTWASSLSALLTGNALLVYGRLSDDDAKDYEILKKALFRRYDLTEEGFRKKFRNTPPDEGESPAQFIVKLKNFLKKWMEQAGAYETFAELQQLVIKEQFINAVSNALEVHLKEKAPANLDDLAKAAEQYLTAHGTELYKEAKVAKKPVYRPPKQTGPSAFENPWHAPNEQVKGTSARDVRCYKCNQPGHIASKCHLSDQSRGPRNDKKCMFCDKFGHDLRECWKLKTIKTAYLDVEKSVEEAQTPVAQVSSFCSISAPPPEMDVAKIDACIKEGKLFLENGFAVPCMNACVPSNEDSMPVTKGRVGSHIVQVLRDSGCSSVVIKQKFVDPDLYTGTLVLVRLADNSFRRAPMAKIHINTPYLIGEVDAKTISKGRVSVDIIGKIHPPSEKGHQFILTMMDHASRYPDAVPLKNIDSESVAEALVDMFSRVGVPEEILSDLGTQFTSDCMKEVARLLSMRQLTTTPYHPMCNGLVEKFNGTLKQMLKKLCQEKPNQWHRYINAVLFAYREVPQESTGFSPFEILYGRSERQIKELVREYEDIFTDIPGTSNKGEHKIELTSHEPVRSKPYPVPYGVRASLRKEIKDMLDMGIIQESASPYASPVVMVKKSDGSNRVCIDFRKLNRITIFDPEPMVTADDVFARLSESNFFTKIDFTKGYWQIKVRSDVPKTAFVTPDGQYEFLKMPFGMVNAGATYVKCMRTLLKGLDNVESYIDDLLVHTKSWSEHLETLQELFQRIRNANLTVRPSKCILASETVQFLGHEIQGGTLSLQETNISKIQSAPQPKTKKEVRSFLGLTGFYRAYVPNYATIASPLSDLTKKGKSNVVQWQEPQEKAYNSLKSILVNKPVLRLPDLNRRFILRTDASDVGLGAVLLQEYEDGLFPNKSEKDEPFLSLRKTVWNKTPIYHTERYE